MSGTADVHKAVNAVWNSSGLDAHFTTYWPSGASSEFTVLNDQEAAAGQPFPYVVFRQDAGLIVSRMSGHSSDERHEIRDVPWLFNIHARKASGSSAKTVAVALAEEITKVFGGHPTVAPTGLTLDNGLHLITQYQNEYGVRTGDDEYQWLLSYRLIVDVPVKG